MEFSFYHSLINLIQLIPSTLWAVVIGSCATFMGSFFANRSAHKRLSLQLNHEKILKKEQRDFDIKKEAYTEILRNLLEYQTYILKLPNLTAEEVKLTPSFNFPEVVLIAPEKTLIVINAISTQLTRGVFELLPKKMKIASLDSDVEIAANLSNKLQENFSNITQLMVNYNLTSHTKPDPSYFSNLKQQSEFLNHQFEHYQNERSQCFKESLELKKELTRECITLLKKINKDQIDLTILFRNELGLNEDLENYRLKLENSVNEAYELVDVLYSKLENTLDES